MICSSFGFNINYIVFSKYELPFKVRYLSLDSLSQLPKKLNTLKCQGKKTASYCFIYTAEMFYYYTLQH